MRVKGRETKAFRYEVSGYSIDFFSCGDIMAIEQEIENEIRKLEREISSIDDELQNIHKKIVDLILLKKKKENELQMLTGSEEEKELQTSLARLFEGS